MSKTLQELIAPLGDVRAAAVAGMVGPLWLGGTILGLTWLQYDFMLGLRWHPLRAPTLDWPSGLALGPYGWLMVGTFVLCGVLMGAFAIGLHRGIAGGTGSRVGPVLLGVTGVALILLGFKADPTFRTTPRTLPGDIHDLAFALLGLSLLPALFFLWRRFRQDPFWRGHASYTLFTALFAAPAFLLSRLAFYLFLVVVLVWFQITAVRLWQVARRRRA